MPPNLKKVIEEDSSDDEASSGVRDQGSATLGSESHIKESCTPASVPRTRYIIPEGFEPIIGRLYIFLPDENRIPRLTACYTNNTRFPDAANGLSNVTFEHQRVSEHQTVQEQNGHQQSDVLPLQHKVASSEGLVRHSDGQQQSIQEHTPHQIGGNSLRTRYKTNPWANVPIKKPPYSAFIPSVNGPIRIATPPGYNDHISYSPGPLLQGVYAPTPVRPDPSGHTLNPRIPPFTPLMPGAFASPNMGPSQTTFTAYSSIPNLPLTNIANVRTRTDSPMASMFGNMRSTPALAPTFAGPSGTVALNSEWGSRYGTPRQSNVHTLAPLPYRPGSDAMYPQPTVNGMSVRLQQMQRAGEPDFPTLMSQQFLPFAENTRQTRPDEWGVMKMTNVSKKGH